MNHFRLYLALKLDHFYLMVLIDLRKTMYSDTYAWYVMSFLHNSNQKGCKFLERRQVILTIDRFMKKYNNVNSAVTDIGDPQCRH